MKETARIISHPDGRYEWKGGLFAIVSADALPPKCNPRKPFGLGGLTLRMVGCVPSTATYLDRYFVMREGILARLVRHYNDTMSDLAMYKLVKFDVAFFRFIGKPLKEGTCLPRWCLASIAYRLRI